MRTYSYTILFVLISFSSYCQEKLELKKLGFSMNVPKDWISVNDETIIENLNKFDFTDEQLNSLLRFNNSAINISSYTKYDLKKHAGIIPTIKIRTLTNPAKNSSDFLKFVEVSIESSKKVYENFAIVEKPRVINITNQDVVMFSVKFTLSNAGTVYEIGSKSYYIPKDGYYISLNFIEQIGKEDNEKFFEKLIQSIQLTK